MPFIHARGEGHTKARRTRDSHQTFTITQTVSTKLQLRACSSRSITARVCSASGPSCRYTSATELSSSAFFTGALAGTCCAFS